MQTNKTSKSTLTDLGRTDELGIDWEVSVEPADAGVWMTPPFMQGYARPAQYASSNGERCDSPESSDYARIYGEDGTFEYYARGPASDERLAKIAAKAIEQCIGYSDEGALVEIGNGEADDMGIMGLLVDENLDMDEWAEAEALVAKGLEAHNAKIASDR